MDLTPFKLDIDELINEFAECNSTTLADMKRIWLSRKFTFIYEARPTTNVAFFMQSLFAHSIRYMVSSNSLSQRLGGLYCLYCLYETQPFRPPFKIYLSLGELKGLKNLVVEAKEENIRVVPALVKRILEKNICLFGAVEPNHNNVTERISRIMKLQDAHMKVAYERLFADIPIDRSLQMDLGMVLDLGVIKKMSMEYATAKERAINEAGKFVDIEGIKHIVETKKPVGDAIEKIVKDWNAKKDVFNQQIGWNRHSTPAGGEVVAYQQDELDQSLNEEDNDAEVDEFGQELELLLA